MQNLPNVLSFNILQFEYLLLFFVSCHCKFNTFGLWIAAWTKQARRHLGLWEAEMDILQYSVLQTKGLIN